MSSALETAVRSMPALDHPASQLSAAWPELGYSNLIGWAVAIERDLRLAAEALAGATAAGPCEQGRTGIEHGYWRLGSARDRLATLAALVTAVPTIEIRKARQIVFRRAAHEHEKLLKRRLNDLAAQGHPAAARFVQLYGESGARLTIRHQQSHGRAPILDPSSLVWVECGHIKSPGGVFGYEALQLLPQGALDADQLTPPALFERALRLLGETRAILESMVEALAGLITDAELPLPVPEVVWRVHETGEHFLSRDDAEQASRTAARVAPVISPFGP